MERIQSNKKFDLDERTKKFAKDCRILIGNLKKSISIIEDCKQLARSSGSVAANYIEASESLSKKDFVHRIKICRKEAKESKLWLELLSNADSLKDPDILIGEATQLMKIFGAIIEKSK